MEFEIEDKNLISKETKNYDCITIPIFKGEDLCYHKFFENVMFKNLPCIIKNVTRNWNASQDWLKDHKPNLDYLEKKYGENKVIIYNCLTRFFNSQKCKDGTLAEYIRYWKNKDSSNALYYLKDWHLKLQSKDDKFYEVPIFFASDWLNEYFTQCLDDDYRFVYIGPKGSWTPLHSDVFTSYSWSVNVCGQKKWLFFPPGEENYLKDDLNNLPYDISEVPHSRKYFEVIQNSGEAIFVPSGWYHQVWNLEDTISINHNWVNGCNIFTMWKSLKQNLENIKKEIADCKDMTNFDEHSQTMLNSLFGLNYKKFYDFIMFIARSRISMLNNTDKRVLFHGHIIGINHIYFDLKRIHEVLEDFLLCEDVNRINCDIKDGKYLLDKIIKALQTYKCKNLKSKKKLVKTAIYQTMGRLFNLIPKCFIVTVVQNKIFFVIGKDVLSRYREGQQN